MVSKIVSKFIFNNTTENNTFINNINLKNSLTTYKGVERDVSNVLKKSVT